MVRLPVDHPSLGVADSPGERHGPAPAARSGGGRPGDTARGAWQRRSRRSRTRPSAWPSSRRCSVATSRTRSSTWAAGTRTCSPDSSTSSPSSSPARPTTTCSPRCTGSTTWPRACGATPSLLVLAGVEPPREWGAPVPLVDVVRAAVGEVEAYQRVLLQRIEPAMIAGSTATDLAHLLAELVENGLAFSPPGLPVEVRGWPASWPPATASASRWPPPANGAPSPPSTSLAF